MDEEDWEDDPGAPKSCVFCNRRLDAPDPFTGSKDHVGRFDQWFNVAHVGCANAYHKAWKKKDSVGEEFAPEEFAKAVQIMELVI